ncbi:MAG: GIY-YIG nuclease family protein [Glaciimonas sp.]|nr:GIY-YIG nuclease family protein [Glaciimonas sp.]
MFTKKYGKTIKMFLMDAEPNGRMICELSNWTGKAYRIPRNRVKDCSSRPELKGTAVYLLFGKPESNDGKLLVYIGEAENIYNRLVQHVSEKDYWNEAVVFISKDENLNKAHIKYLESRLYEAAVLANRYEIKNSLTPTKSSISENDQAEMEEFAEYIKMLINVMGFKVFEPIHSNQAKDNKEDNFLFINAARGANAKGQRTSDGFVVLGGSEIAMLTAASLPNGIAKLRQALIDGEIVLETNNKLTFKDDYLFNSPSAAAAVVMGRSANGLLEWKDKSGKTLKDIEYNEIAKANVRP